MAVLEAVVVLGLVGIIVYSTIRMLTRPPARRSAAALTGRWCTSHYDIRGETRVVVQKIAPSGREVLDEHVVATIRVEDPEYDAKFLAAMSSARERRALFESEDG